MDFEDTIFTAQNLAQMSEAEFDEMNELNEVPVNGVLDKFGTLPPEIQEIGAEALAAFIAGLTDGDLSEQVESFTDKFAADFSEGLENAFVGTELNYSALLNADTYSIGKKRARTTLTASTRLWSRFRLLLLPSRISRRQAPLRNGTRRPFRRPPRNSPRWEASADRIVIQNHIEVDMDGEKVAEKVIEKEEIQLFNDIIKFGNAFSVFFKLSFCIFRRFLPMYLGSRPYLFYKFVFVGNSKHACGTKAIFSNRCRCISRQSIQHY